MGFLDQLGKKAVETVQGAKDKTTKISSEMKLKSQISEKEDRVFILYSEMGKEVYSNYEKGIENNTESIISKIKEISEIKDELKRLNDNLLALKDIKVCISCGEKVPADADYCPKCGVKQVVIVNNAPESAKEAAESKEKVESEYTTKPEQVDSVKQEEPIPNTENTQNIENNEI